MGICGAPFSKRAHTINTAIKAIKELRYRFKDKYKFLRVSFDVRYVVLF